MSGWALPVAAWCLCVMAVGQEVGARGPGCVTDVCALLGTVFQTHGHTASDVHHELSPQCCLFLYPLTHFLQAAKADDLADLALNAAKHV